MWVSREHIRELRERIDEQRQHAEYWQKQYEIERKRADKLTDNLLMTNGLPSPSVQEVAPQTSLDHPRAFIKQYMSELMEEEINDKLEREDSGEQVTTQSESLSE